MSVDELEGLRYPIGRFQPRPSIDPSYRVELIETIEALPGRLREAVGGLREEQLDTPYRPGGWTVRQVVHHLPDSHVNAYVRFKLAVTEDTPTICAYDQDAWASLADAREAPIELSLGILDALHARWGLMLRGLSAADWEREFNHPESGRVGLDDYLQLYAWHGEHHLAHIRNLAARNGW
jgi:hypothetical protein